MAAVAHKVVLNALVKKYRQVWGELPVVEREIEPVSGRDAMDEASDEIIRKQRNLNAALDHLHHVILLFDPTRTPKSVTPPADGESPVILQSNNDTEVQARP